MCIRDRDTDAVAADDSPAVNFVEEIAKNMNLSMDVKGFIKEDVLYICLLYTSLFLYCRSGDFCRYGLLS